MLDLIEQTSGTPVKVAVRELVIAGFAGRDQEAVEEHVKELAEIGVQRPSSIPIFYRCTNDLLTTADKVQMLGEDSSGEVETIILADEAGKLWVGLASDHTDRKVEAYSVAVSKQVCCKPMAKEVWAFEEVKDHWDKLELRAWATIGGERVLYQEGSVAGLLSPADLAKAYAKAEKLSAGQAMLGGTMSAIGGVRPADRFEMELVDPVLNRKLSHGYDIQTLPVVA